MALAAKDRFKNTLLSLQYRSMTERDRKERSGIVDECFNYYCQWIERRFKDINTSHFAPCYAAPEPVNSPCNILNLVVMYNMLTLMAQTIISKDQLTLQEIIDEQGHNGDFDTNYPGTSGLLTQLIFMAFGWMTMLYDPEMAPSPNELSLSRQTRVSHRAFNTTVLLSYEQGFALVQQPLGRLFRVFGNIIPQSEDTNAELTHMLSSPTASGPYQSSEYLVLSYLSYHTLSRVAQIKIEWVDCINLHLEFDEGRRLLKLFRFPSFCRLAYPSKGRKTFLYR